MVIEVTVQVRVSDFEKGLNWYRMLLRREPEYAPHEGFAEWELIPGSWLQVNKGTPAEGSGPLRLGVTDLEAERNRVIDELGVEPFEVHSRKEVNAKWATFSDPWGNHIGFFEYLDKADETKTIERVLNR